jgi:hypothetical protein
MKKPRNYKKEEKYEDSPQQVKNRVMRNKMRRKLMREGKVHKGDGKDVAHIVALDKGGTNADGVRVESASGNRSFRRDSNHNLVSEVSKREKKRKK